MFSSQIEPSRDQDDPKLFLKRLVSAMSDGSARTSPSQSTSSQHSSSCDPKGLAPNQSVNPYVEVEVYHADDKSKESKVLLEKADLILRQRMIFCLGTPHRNETQIIQDNGFNPIFDKKFNFALTTKYPELVFVDADSKMFQ